MRTIETNTGGALFEKQPNTLAEIVGVHQLVRNAESECLQCGFNDTTGVTVPLHSGC